MNEIRKVKVSLRKNILDERDSLSLEKLKAKSLSIKKVLFDLAVYKNANNIMYYVSFRSEVMTDSAIKETLAKNKNIIIPRVVKHLRLIKTFSIKDFNNDLTIGEYGILEPKPMQCARAKTDEIDIVLVPGSAFSVEGDRLGYGAGYYDRFLSKLPDRVKKIALAFDLQIVQNIPTEATDIKMDMIITEKRVIDCNSEKEESY